MKSRQGNLFASFSATQQSDEKIAHYYNLYKQKKLSWQPNLGMLTKSHSLYDNGTISIPISNQKQAMKNPLAGTKSFDSQSDDFFRALNKAQSWKKKYNDIDEIPDSLVPSSYDFRNIDGYDFTGPVRDQAECGSCFALSFIQVIEARLKLKYGGN